MDSSLDAIRRLVDAEAALAALESGAACVMGDERAERVDAAVAHRALAAAIRRRLGEETTR